MAQVPNDTTQTVSPDVRLPDDYSHIQANPEAFGADIGQATQNLGQAAQKVSQFYGQVAADDGTNKYVTNVNQLLYGDPTKTVQHPDGSMGPDTGYFGLKGADQMSAYPNVIEKLDSLRNDTRATLQTPESQLQFDEYSRRFSQMKQSEIGQRYETAQNEWGLKTNQDASKIHVDDVARDAATGDYSGKPETDPAFVGHLENLKASYVRTAQLQGLGHDGIDLAAQNAVRDAWATRIETLSAMGPTQAVQAGKLVEDHRADLGAQYEKLKESVQGRVEQGTADAASQHLMGQIKRGETPSLPGSGGGSPDTGAPLAGQKSGQRDFTQYNKMLNSGDVQGALRWSEGLRTTPYFDVNHLRTGYGSDTVTRADGTVETVTPGTTITQADAERDLARRTQQYATKAAETIGPAWGNLTPGAQSALTSIAYNYGHVPNDVARAASTGDPGAIAAAIRNHASDNDGANYNRRLAEASAVLGVGGSAAAAGVPPAPAAASAVATPQMGPEGGSTAAPVPPPAAPDLPAPPAPPGAPEQPATPEQMKAAALQAIESSDMSDGAKERTVRAVTQQLATEEIIANQTAKAKKDASDKASDGYVTTMLSGHAPPNFIQQIANDPHLEWQTKLHLFDAAKAHSGTDVEEAANAYGPGFWDAYKHITAPAGTEGKITDPDELIRRAGPGGDLTLNGVAKLRQSMVEMQKSANDASVGQAKAGLLNYARSKMSFDQEMLFPGVPPLKDQKGVQIFEGQFIPKFESAYDQWVKGGKDPWQFLTKDNVDKLADGMRNPREMAQDKIAAGQNASGDVVGAEPGAAAMPIPQGVKPDDWSTMLRSPPAHADGSRINPTSWAKTLEIFGSNPNEEMVKMFDESQARRAAAGQPTLAISGQEILSGLQGKLRPSSATPAVETPNAMPIYTGP